jgi:crotonobetainyl-CoA:carnitine CoA-transferase CaiB-like acyl-CoA transferase
MHLRPGSDSAIYLGFNRGKRSIALNLKSADGRAAAHRLAREADVVVQNFRPAVAARLGVDAATLTAANSRLIYCAVSAFGEDGPMADLPGNDPLIQGISGAMLASDPSDPIRLGMSLPDFAGGLLAAVGILAALRIRSKDRVGCTSP